MAPFFHTWGGVPACQNGHDGQNGRDSHNGHDGHNGHNGQIRPVRPLAAYGRRSRGTGAVELHTGLATVVASAGFREARPPTVAHGLRLAGVTLVPDELWGQ